MMDIKRGIVKSFDAATYTASVQLVGSPVWLTGLPVAKHLAAGILSAGTRCGVIFFDESNPTDACLAFVYDGTPAAWVTSALLVDGTVATADIADDAVTAAKIAAGAVGSSEIADGSVGSAELADDSVTAAKIATGAVGASEIADGSVGTAELADSAVTSAKIAPSTIVAADCAGNQASGVATYDGSANLNAPGQVNIVGRHGIGSTSPRGKSDFKDSTGYGTLTCVEHTWNGYIAQDGAAHPLVEIAVGDLYSSYNSLVVELVVNAVTSGNEPGNVSHYRLYNVARRGSWGAHDTIIISSDYYDTGNGYQNTTISTSWSGGTFQIKIASYVNWGGSFNAFAYVRIIGLGIGTITYH